MIIAIIAIVTVAGVITSISFAIPYGLAIAKPSRLSDLKEYALQMMF
jgi:hypothetical protein